MNKAEYEAKISDISNRMDDLISEINDLWDEAKRIGRTIEDLPELSEVEPDEAED